MAGEVFPLYACARCGFRYRDPEGDPGDEWQPQSCPACRIRAALPVDVPKGTADVSLAMNVYRRVRERLAPFGGQEIESCREALAQAAADAFRDVLAEYPRATPKGAPHGGHE